VKGSNRNYSKTNVRVRQDPEKDAVRDRVAGEIDLWLKAKPERNLTHFAALIGAPYSTVQRWTDPEGSAPEAGWLTRFAKTLSLSGHWLLTGDGKREAPGEKAIGPPRLPPLVAACPNYSPSASIAAADSEAALVSEHLREASFFPSTPTAEREQRQQRGPKASIIPALAVQAPARNSQTAVRRP